MFVLLTLIFMQKIVTISREKETSVCHGLLSVTVIDTMAKINLEEERGAVWPTGSSPSLREARAEV